MSCVVPQGITAQAVIPDYANDADVPVPNINVDTYEPIRYPVATPPPPLPLRLLCLLLPLLYCTLDLQLRVLAATTLLGIV